MGAVDTARLRHGSDFSKYGGVVGRPVAVDVLWLAVGLLTGVIGTAVAVEALGKSRGKDSTPDTKITTAWHLKEMAGGVIVARDLLDVAVPQGTQIYSSGVVDPTLLTTCKVQQVPPVRAEFALDTQRDRAWLFTAGIRPGSLALLTVDPVLVDRLRSEWRSIASKADAYIERLRVAQLAGRSGVTVETQGLVQDVLPFKDRFMIRLEDQGAIIGVLVQKDPSGLKDEQILVRGDLEKDSTGYAVIQAEEIRRIR